MHIQNEARVLSPRWFGHTALLLLLDLLRRDELTIDACLAKVKLVSRRL